MATTTRVSLSVVSPFHPHLALPGSPRLKQLDRTAIGRKCPVRRHEPQRLTERLGEQQAIKGIRVMQRVSGNRCGMGSGVTVSSSNPVASIAAAKAWASPSILPSRALMAIFQIEAADTYTACARGEVDPCICLELPARHRRTDKDVRVEQQPYQRPSNCPRTSAKSGASKPLATLTLPFRTLTRNS